MTAVTHASLRREGDVVLRDGSTVHVRPTVDDDTAALTDFYLRLSERSRWMRFMSSWSRYDRFAEQAASPHDASRLDLVAVSGQAIVAHAMYVTTAPKRAEVAFAVDDRLRGQGLATLLLGQLADAAAGAGIDTFEAVTLPQNRDMMGVFRESGFGGVITTSPDEIEIEFPTALTPDALARFDARDRIAAAAAVRSIVSPGSIAVVGASRNEDSIGGAVLRNLLDGAFRGAIYPVNPNADTIRSLRSYASVTDIPGDVDLAVIVVPAPAVVEVARQCAAKGVRSLVVISAGFTETDDEGAARQRELMDVCRTAGMRVVGPNCFGVINTDADVSMNATFARSMPPTGRLGFLTQSGALGLSVMDQVAKLGLGLSTFVSNGNKADISGNDLLSYWETDDATDVILLYLESFGNPRKFARVARHVGKTKPILAVKSGRSAAGARATGSHTGAMLAASDLNVDALFRQSGVIRCDTLSELFDTAQFLARQPLPGGNRVAIVTNAGGLGILCADVCEDQGLEVAAFPDELQEELRASLAPGASAINPVDMIAGATADDYVRTIEAIARSGAADAIVAMFIAPRVTQPKDIAEALVEAAERIRGYERAPSLAAVFMSADDESVSLVRGHVPTYDYPEEAARALGHVVRYRAWRDRPEGHRRLFADTRPGEAADVISSALASDTEWLQAHDVATMLDCYGIKRARQDVAASPEDAARKAAEIGFPVALKAEAVGLVHKTEAGAVRVGLKNRSEVRREALAMKQRLADIGIAEPMFLVQEMVSSSVEILVGVVNDELFGPVVAVGAGGTTAELLGDVAVRLTPLSDGDVPDMIHSLRTAKLLYGYRGRDAVDVAALQDLIHRVGAMVEAHPEIAELDCNPVAVTPEGAFVLDARMRIEPAAPKALFGARV